MAAEIKPGGWITVKVASEPKAAAGIKTMIRLFERDPAVRRERQRKAKARPVTTHRRGGRPWADRPPRLRVVSTAPGATYKLFASVDVLRDLESIAPYVQVTPA